MELPAIKTQMEKVVAALEGRTLTRAEDLLSPIAELEPTPETAPYVVSAALMLSGLLASRSDISAVELLERAHALGERFTTVPASLAAEIALTLGSCYFEHGDMGRTESVLQTAVLRARSCSPPDLALLATGLCALAAIL